MALVINTGYSITILAGDIGILHISFLLTLNFVLKTKMIFPIFEHSFPENNSVI